MRGIHRYHGTIGFWCDTGVTFVSLCLMLYSVVVAVSNNWPPGNIILPALLINIFTGAWMAIRLSPSAINLCQGNSFREGIYLANIDAETYLWNRFDARITMSAMPSIATFLPCMLGLYLSGHLNMREPLEALFTIALMVVLYMTPLLGEVLLFRLVEVQCNLRKSSLSPTGHAVLNGFLGAGYGAAILLSVFPLTANAASAITVAVLYYLPMLTILMFWPKKQFNRAAQALYSFVDE